MTDFEIDELLRSVQEIYGYDFSEFARASLERRINRIFSLDRFPSFAELRYKVLGDPIYFQRFVEEITVNVTEMFRDPAFYRVLRQEVFPILSAHPLIRIWHAGCSTGEEVYSVAIVLREMGLLSRSLLYATDINPGVLEQAKKGIFHLMHMKQYSENYILSGGTHEFSEYYTANYDRAVFDKTLSERMIFASHNLVSDRSFNEFQLILCRNVLIYFDRNLQAKVFSLFDESLESRGFLALGSKETLRFSPLAPKFTAFNEREKIWCKIAG